jgi:pimeloyl-ACP methyl ester carboxylesterase
MLHFEPSWQNGGRSSRERVVLVHCSASSARQWKTLADELVGFQPVSLDLYGHGTRTRWDGRGPLGLSEEAAAIGDACPDGAPFHLVGHSYGGGVALRFAADHTERLLSLTLIEPSCFHLLRTGDAEGRHLLGELLAVADAVNLGVICGDYRSGMETFIDYWSGAGAWASLSEDKQAHLAGLAIHIAHHFWGLIQEDKSLAAYAAVNVPTLILCGTRSPKPSRAITRMLADALPRVRHRTIRNVGHMSPLTHPAVVNPFILQHLLMNGVQHGIPDTVHQDAGQPLCSGDDLAVKAPWLAGAVAAPDANHARPSARLNPS